LLNDKISYRFLYVPNLAEHDTLNSRVRWTLNNAGTIMFATDVCKDFQN